VKKNFDKFLFRVLKTVLNNAEVPGIVRNWREIILKNSRLLISAAPFTIAEWSKA
jgi:hypothetical protein